MSIRDVLIVGAGPTGLSAAIAARKRNLDYQVLEQGTLIGLVQMLGSMSDPKQIAPAMAIALLTTLYGALIANVIAIPIADKLALRSTDERLAKSLIIDAVMSIQDGQHPRVMQDLLKNYLPKNRRSEEQRAA